MPRVRIVAFIGIHLFSCCLRLSAGQELAPKIQPRTNDQQGYPLAPLATDRPDFTETSEVVGAGVVQFEMGSTLAKEDSVLHLTQPQLLTRIGLTDRVEVRFATEGYLFDRAQDSSWSHGFADTEIGLKVKLWEQRHFLPALSLIPNLSMPTGSRLYSSGGYEPGIDFVLSKDLFAGFTIGSNINLSSAIESSGRYLQRALSASLGHDLFRGFDGYCEVYGFTPYDDGTKSAWIINGGITHPVGPNAQVDFSLGRRVTELGPNWFVGVGFAFRHPTDLLGKRSARAKARNALPNA